MYNSGTLLALPPSMYAEINPLQAHDGLGDTAAKQ